MRLWSKAALACWFVVACATGAWAHGEVDSYEPQAGSRLAKPPKRVVVMLTETPASGSSKVEVRDGCRRSVATRVFIDDAALVAEIGDAQAGTWNVSWSAVSSVDGHPTKGKYAFGVRGKADCSRSEDSPDQDGGAAAAEGDGSSFPIVPAVIGTVVVIALAYVLRRSTG